MPSPLGHALGGVAIGWLVDAPAVRDRAAVMRSAVAFALVAALPDIDLLFLTHRGPTHGIGAAAVVGAVAFAITRRIRPAVAFALAYSSHILFDWLGTDTTPPIGLMALWPLSHEYYQSPSHIFMAVSRRYWLPEFWTYNLRVVLRELLILGPLLVLAGLLRRARAKALGLSLIVALCPASRAAAQPSFAYIEAIEQYRSGQTKPAIEAVRGMSAADLRPRADVQRAGSEDAGRIDRCRERGAAGARVLPRGGSDTAAEARRHADRRLSYL